MKNLLLVLSLIVLVAACNDKPYGNWVLYKSNEKGIYSEPPRIKILEDSIEFCPWNYNSWDKYSYTLNKSKLNIGKTEIDFKIEQDTLILNGLIKYIRAKSKRAIELYGKTNIDIKIDLPKIKGTQPLEYLKPEYGTYIRYGRRHDNGLFSLQLNDKYVDLKELSKFVAYKPGCFKQDFRPQTHYFFCDSGAKMKDVESIFLVMSSVNEGRLVLINKEELTFNDSLVFSYRSNGLKIRMNLPDYTSNYAGKKLNHINDGKETPPYRNYNVLNWSLKNQSQQDYSNVISLVKNKLFFNGIKIEKNELLVLLKNDIIKQNSIITLYDLESNYYHFLELQLTISSVYNILREEESLKMYNKPLQSITKDELHEVKRKIPMRILWSYSIPHIKSMYENDRVFLDMKIKPLDSVLPKNIAY